MPLPSVKSRPYPLPMQWSELPKAVRREVLQGANAGQRHPDAAVAAAAYTWAKDSPQSRTARSLDFMGEVLSGVFAPGSANLGDMRERFAAHRVARLGPPATTEG